jgi:hypothetical protein
LGALALFFCVADSSTAAAAPPPNDAFAQPMRLASGTVMADATNLGATKEPGEPNHGGDPGGASVWFQWSPTSAGVYEINTCGSAAWNVFAVYTGSTLSALSPVVESVDHGCRAGFRARPDTNYRIAIDGSTEVGAVRQGALHIDLHPMVLVSDEWSGFDLGQGMGSDWLTNVGAGKEPNEPDHAGDPGGASLWFSWRAPESGRFTVDLCHSDIDTVLGIYTGASVDGLTEVASNDDSCGKQSRIEFNAVEGTVYRFGMDGKRQPDGQADQGVIRYAIAGPPGNDDFAEAWPRDPVPGSQWLGTDGSNVRANKEPGEPDHAGDPGGASVWYSWTAPFDGRFAADTCSANFDTVIGVYAGSSLESLTEVGGNDDWCGKQSRAKFDATKGTTYRIAVDGSTNGGTEPAAEGSFRIDMEYAPPILINLGHSVTGTPDIPIKFSFVPPNPMRVQVSNDPSFSDAVEFSPAPVIPWRLDTSEPSEALKRVYVRVVDRGRIIDDAQAEITLDMVPPEVLSASMRAGGRKGGGRPREKAGLRVRLRARDATSQVAQLQFARIRRQPKPLQPFAGRVAVRRPPRFVRVVDLAGNYSEWAKVRAR